MTPTRLQLTRYAKDGGSFTDKFNIILECEANKTKVEIASLISDHKARIAKWCLDAEKLGFDNPKLASRIRNLKTNIKRANAKIANLESALRELEGYRFQSYKRNADIEKANLIVKGMINGQEELADAESIPYDRCVIVYESAYQMEREYKISNPGSTSRTFSICLLLDALFWWRRRYQFNSTVAQNLHEVRYNEGRLYFLIDRPSNTEASAMCAGLGIQLNIDYDQLAPIGGDYFPFGLVLYKEGEEVPRFSYSETLRKHFYNPMKHEYQHKNK